MYLWRVAKLSGRCSKHQLINLLKAYKTIPTGCVDSMLALYSQDLVQVTACKRMSLAHQNSDSFQVHVMDYRFINTVTDNITFSLFTLMTGVMLTSCQNYEVLIVWQSMIKLLPPYFVPRRNSERTLQSLALSTLADKLWILRKLQIPKIRFNYLTTGVNFLR